MHLSPSDDSTTLFAYSGVHRRSTTLHSCLSVPDLRHKKSHDMPSRQISFSTISFREYNQTLGDNPSCQTGAPVTLDWAYEEKTSIALEEFEEIRQKRKRRRSDLVLGIFERRKLLLTNGLTLLDIMHAEHMVALKNGTGSIGVQLGGRKLQGEVVMKSPNPYMNVTSSKKSVVSRAA